MLRVDIRGTGYSYGDCRCGYSYSDDVDEYDYDFYSDPETMNMYTKEQVDEFYEALQPKDEAERDKWKQEWINANPDVPIAKYWQASLDSGKPGSIGVWRFLAMRKFKAEELLTDDERRAAIGYAWQNEDLTVKTLEELVTVAKVAIASNYCDSVWPLVPDNWRFGNGGLTDSGWECYYGILKAIGLRTIAAIPYLACTADKYDECRRDAPARNIGETIVNGILCQLKRACARSEGLWKEKNWRCLFLEGYIDADDYCDLRKTDIRARLHDVAPFVPYEEEEFAELLVGGTITENEAEILNGSAASELAEIEKEIEEKRRAEEACQVSEEDDGKPDCPKEKQQPVEEDAVHRLIPSQHQGGKNGK
jgi:hypothetical protein